MLYTTNNTQELYGNNQDAIIGEKQSAAIKNITILHTFFTIRDVIDVSHKLNSNLGWISLNFCGSFTE